MLAFGAPILRGRAALRGLLAAALGLIVLVWPGITVGVAVALFAIYCFADAITRLVSLFQEDRSTAQRVVMILVGLLDVAAGIVAVAYPGITAQALVVVIGIWAILLGAAELAGAWSGVAGAGWLTLGGVISIAAGVVLIAWPGIGAFSLSIIFGAYLLAYGVTLLVSAAFPSRATAGAEVEGATL
ncbi:MAG: protein of unknown function rane [Solirubrobacterales bacterium]|nr:protein of unknown function rane [Solirubrobacterales bacterium]